MSDIKQEIQKLTPDSYIELFQLDLTALVDIGRPYITQGGSYILYWTNNRINYERNPIFGGKEYTPLPVEMVGFDNDSSGALARPEITIGNINVDGVGGLFTDLLQIFNECIGATVKRIRTFAKYLDNFGPTADSSATLPIDLYIVSQLIRHDKQAISFMLRNPLDDENKTIPGEKCGRTCQETYRRYAGSGVGFMAGTCRYKDTGDGAYFTRYGKKTGDPALDECGKRLEDCRKRFKQEEILFRGFPSVGT